MSSPSSKNTYPKCTATEKNAFAVGVRNRLAERKVKGVNAIKAAMLESLVEKNEKGRNRYLRFNKAAEKAVLGHVKEQPQEIQDEVLSLITEYRKILESKPKQLLSAYMKFNIALGKTDDLKGNTFTERAPKVKEAWGKLSEGKKDEYKPTTAERTSYETARNRFDTSIKSFKKP